MSQECSIDADADLGNNPNTAFAEGYQRALRLLARREHGVTELTRKLCQKGVAAEVAAAVTEALVARNYLSDSRYVQSFTRQRAAQGSGPLKITAELRQHGIAATLITTALQDAAYDWYALARACYQQRYRSEATEAAIDWRERGKRQRFLQGRGFDYQQICYAMEREGTRVDDD
ncbi:MAG: regulatory protein RecX [Gammaproteobacteria bacterium]|nr:regulatory protein RecX [Gammaproteobacteria bacterium]